MKKPKALVAEYIEWSDHVSLAESGWKSKKDAMGLTATICKTVGFVIRETRTEVNLVSSIADDHVDGEVCIIKACIVKREKLWPK